MASLHTITIPPADSITIPSNTIVCPPNNTIHFHPAQTHIEPHPDTLAAIPLKPPLTPAAFTEPNGSPALRWRCYTASNLREPECSEKASASAMPVDSKGKLVINLCGVSRSSDTKQLVTASANAKGDMARDAGGMTFEPNVSSKGHSVHYEAAEAAPLSVNIEDIEETHQEEPPSESDNIPQFYASPFKVTDSARKLCLRIKRIRRSVNSMSRDPQSLQRSKETFAKDILRFKNEYRSGEHLAEISRSSDDARGIESNDGLSKPVEGSLLRDQFDTFGSTRNPSLTTKGQENDETNDLKMQTISLMRNDECNDGRLKDNDFVPKDMAGKYINKARRNTKNDACGFSETSKLDMKEQTVLETLLHDEHAGYSSGGYSEPSRSYRSGKPLKPEPEQYESDDDDVESERKVDIESIQTDGCEGPEKDTCRIDECAGGMSDHDNGSPNLPSDCRQEKFESEQVPSVLCDAEGNVWNIGKRAEQARGAKEGREMASQERMLYDHHRKQASFELQRNDSPASSIAPFENLIETSWKWPLDSEYSINAVTDVSNRAVIAKERSVFVGCIPDGTENLEAVLQNLMSKFLERFDFAPAILNQIRAAKIGKDYAFLELAMEKVAHIVLGANQLDVFEWGVNGFHFNIEGCKGTYTSVRPLIEYMPLKPARVIFVGNIPKSRWQKEYLEGFFARLLCGSDRQADSSIVSSVFLLPESCDAYVELASEMMADSIVFKCTKCPQLLKDIGEDAFICRDPSSVPLMSKHKGIICPQRSLFVSVSTPGQEFKIDTVRKIFEEILPVISRETSQPGYLEFVNVQPGKDYAFFQFNSEAIVNAVMDEYIKNTQMFTTNFTSLSFIILRPPGYVRPGAIYKSDVSHRGLSNAGVFPQEHTAIDKKGWSKSKAKQPGSIPIMTRRFGDEPPKKADCVMSIGASLPPMATWNGLSSAGAYAADADCMLVIEGLPKGISYKLLRGALNELFERALCRSGLLEVGMLVLRYLDRDGDLDAIASLPNAKFVTTLLSMRKVFAVAGNEVRLLPKHGKRRIDWKGHPIDHVRSHGDVSYLSDDDINVIRDIARFPCLPEQGLLCSSRRKRGFSDFASFSHPMEGHSARRKGFELDKGGWCEQESPHRISCQFKKVKQDRKVSQQWTVARGTHKGVFSTCNVNQAEKVSKLQGMNQKRKMFRANGGPVTLKSRCKNLGQINDDGCDDVPGEILHIVSAGGKRKIKSMDTQAAGYKGKVVQKSAFIQRRKSLLHGIVRTPAFTQRRRRNHFSFS